MFGTVGGGSMGLKGPVFGHSGNAKKIAFVCDASGSMVSNSAHFAGNFPAAFGSLSRCSHSA